MQKEQIIQSMGQLDLIKLTPIYIINWQLLHCKIVV